MIELKVTSKYLEEVPATYSYSEDIEGLKEHLDTLGDICDEIDLEDWIYDYVKYSSDTPYTNLKSDYDVVEDSIEIKIDNIDELVQHFKYLIKEEVNCCAGEHGRYCSKCGLKLR